MIKEENTTSVFRFFLFIKLKKKEKEEEKCFKQVDNSVVLQYHIDCVDFDSS